MALVLWITLFSRIGIESRRFLLPFYSYMEILKGNWRFLIENIGNIVLFFPLGVILKCINIGNDKKIFRMGFLLSLCIEIFQLAFGLGTFEVDDLIHNTFGVMIGYWLILKKYGTFHIKLRNGSIVILSTIFFLLIPLGNQVLHQQKMIRWASMNDRKDGKKNLLVLNGKNNEVLDTDVRVKYLNDGSIRITGTSDKLSWCRIGDIVLEPGEYSFTGLFMEDAEKVGLELEKDNTRFAPDVGSVEVVNFTLEETTELKVYVIVYDGCNCDVIARPAIYKER